MTYGTHSSIQRVILYYREGDLRMEDKWYKGCIQIQAKNIEDFKERLRNNMYPIEDLLEIKEVKKHGR